MNGFHDVSFPAPWARGASGGPQRRTDIVRLKSGAERRTGVWADARRRWDLGGLVVSLADLERLIAFFEAREGRLFGFRFHDLTDWRSCADGGTPGPADQAIGVGDGVADRFFLAKRYGDAAHGVSRAIVAPRAGSVTIALNGAALDPSAFTVEAGGAVRFVEPPAPGASVTAGFDFDCAARFDADRIDYALEGRGAARLHALAILELGAGDVRGV